MLLSLCAINLLTAQSHIIRGTVTDENGSPLPFVTVFLTTSQTGTITNNDGAFALHFSRNADILRASFMGYETQTIDVSTSTGFLNIRLRPSAIQLGEIVVTALSAEELLRKAIERIPDNFRQEPFLVRSYVRNKVLEADSILFMQEMALNIVKSYHTSFSDQFFLARNRNFRFTSERNSVRGVGDFDVVSNVSNWFNARFFRNHEIEDLPSSSFNNRPVHVLGFSPRDTRSGSLNGRVYIDAEDLAFVRFEITFEGGRMPGSSLIVQYEKIGDKYYLMHATATAINRRRDRTIPVETSMITTAIIHSFSQDDIEGTHVRRNDILAWQATQEYDTLFWQQHNALLPDSAILRALERYAEAQRRDTITPIEPIALTADTLEKHTEVQGNSAVATFGLIDLRTGDVVIPAERNQQTQTPPRRLYVPNLSLMVSSDLASDFSSFNHNLNSINRYALHRIRGIRNPLVGILGLTAYIYVVSPPLENATSEWLLLNKNGMQAGMNPTVFNRSGASHLFGINDLVLSDFKKNSHLDFLRLHTIRHDGAFARAFLIEEELAKVDFRHGMNAQNYLFLYWTELLQLRVVNLISPFRTREVRTFDGPENRQPIIMDRGRSWVKYLFRPEMDFQRHIQQADLTDEEQRYLRRVARWSWLNLASPQMFFMPRFSLGENHSFTFSINYLPVPFGEMFRQNIWFMQNHSQLHGVFLSQYRNFEQTFFGIGYKLYDMRLFANMYVTSSVDFWQQPEDFNFRTTSAFNGFRIGQTFEYRTLRNQFSGHSRLSILLGYNYKTKGYMPESFFMGENFNVSVGFRWNF
ncbi:MAG: carboxypeptidase-like regulatory domain-containing protein [Bacteroidales bacterium]|nr:carboxypeptidase-like regulatory domain-containing protein [Bacteroidales bacterium]